jgi:hypothetical protein
MWLTRVTFDTVTALIQGVDMASQGGMLAGFREWLVIRLDGGSNLVWTALVKEIACSTSANESVTSEALIEQNLINTTFRLLDEYWDDREKQGLRGIYLKHEQWLRKQEWYGPDSPKYFSLE